MLQVDIKWLQQQNVKNCREPSNKAWILACPTGEQGAGQKQLFQKLWFTLIQRCQAHLIHIHLLCLYHRSTSFSQFLKCLVCYCCCFLRLAFYYFLLSSLAAFLSFPVSLFSRTSCKTLIWP